VPFDNPLIFVYRVTHMNQSRVAEIPLDFRSDASELAKPSRLQDLKLANCVRLIACGDAIAITFAAVAAKVLYIDLYLGEPQSWFSYLALTPLLALTVLAFLRLDGFYELRTLNSEVIGYGRLLGALGMSMLLLIGVLYLFKVAEIYSRGWFITWALLSAVFLVWGRVIANARVRKIVAQGRLYQRAALFGSAEFIASLQRHVEEHAPSFGVVGVYAAPGISGPAANFDGGIAELRDAIEQGKFETVIIGFPAQAHREIQEATKALGSYSTELLLCTELTAFPATVMGSRDLGSLKANVVNVAPRSETTPIKSICDYILAAAALVLLAPLMAFIALAIKLDSPGPVFFRQRRYGRNNQIFRIFKFRTMTVADDGAVVKQAERNDARVTRLGKFLRRTSLDEIPQLINVLLGHMSIVGPRPHALAHDHYYESELDLFSRRRCVRPGLTGWAQIHGLRGETRTTDDMRRRMQHDLYYINNWSIWLDIEIMTRTVFTLFRGAY